MVKNLPANAGDAGDTGSILGSGRSPGEGNSNPLQYSCLENPMDKGARWATVHGVEKSWTRLSDFAHNPLFFLKQPCTRDRIRLCWLQFPHSSPLWALVSATMYPTLTDFGSFLVLQRLSIPLCFHWKHLEVTLEISFFWAASPWFMWDVIWRLHLELASTISIILAPGQKIGLGMGMCPGFRSPDVNSRLIGKVPDAGKD